MDKKTLTALRGSIKKWERIVTGHGHDDGSDNCPLCALFYDNYLSCKGCPVNDRTGQWGCGGSPYTDWRKALRIEASKLLGLEGLEMYEVVDEGFVVGPRTQAAAIKEYEFLVSLLPDET